MASGVSMTYLADLELSLVADGCDTRRYLWGDWPLLAGWRSDQYGDPRRAVMLFTVAVAMDDVSLAGFRSFERKAVKFARLLRTDMSEWHRLDTMVFPAMIGTHVNYDAVVWAARRQHRWGDVLSRPVIIDEGRGRVSTFRGRPLVGRFLAGYVDEKRDRYFPMVAAVQG
jgi:hypothetical protein